MRANLYDSINNTYSWDRGPEPFLWAGTPPLSYGPADPVPEWSAYYGAPGWDAEHRHIRDTTIAFKRYLPQTGINPWDHVFGPIGANVGIPPVAARYIRSQQGRYSMV